jgi:hypothetical protein
MAKAKKKPIVKSMAVDKAIASAIDSLTSACTTGAVAIASRTNDAKKLTAEGKRLAKKKTVLTKRKSAAAAKLKKAPNAETRKLLNATVKELAIVTKASAKSRAEKAANAEELTGLKAGFKKADTFMKLIGKAERALNKTKTKKKKRK